MKIKGLASVLTVFSLVFVGCSNHDTSGNSHEIDFDIPEEFKESKVFSFKSGEVSQYFVFRNLNDTSIKYYLLVSRVNCSQVYSGTAFLSYKNTTSGSNRTTSSYLVQNSSSFTEIEILTGKEQGVRLQFKVTESGDCIGESNNTLQEAS